MSVDWLSTLERKASLRERAGLRRDVRPRAGDADLVDLAGNDYLGLSRHPRVLAAAGRALAEFGVGATGSRLVRGTTTVHTALDQALADLIGTPAALVYSSGYLANLGVVQGLTQVLPFVVADAHNHASLVDGCWLARGHRQAVTVEVVAHADPAAVDEALSRRAGRPALVLTESVFSVDGDLAPLRALHRVSRAHGAVLVIDEAHAVGVLGAQGGGAAREAGLVGASDVVITATLSKALGAAGGVVAGPAALIRHLVDTGRTFIFDTGLPPAVAAGALAAVELVRGAFGVAGRAELARRAHWAGAQLRAAGFAVAEPAGGVISVTAPGPAQAVAWAGACRQRGVAVGCFRPPATPDGTARLRLTVNTGVGPAEFARAIEVIVEEAPR